MEEPVQLVRRGLEAFEAGGLDAWIDEVVAPDAQFIQHTSVVVDARTWYGHEGWRAMFSEWIGEFDDWQAEFDEPVAAGGADVLVTGSNRGRGRQSNALVERPMAFLHTVSQGKIVRTVQFSDEREARGATGLADPG